MGATLWLTAYCADRLIPSVAPDFEVTNLTVAFLAIAPAHSTSRADSASSLQSGNPGSGPFTIICGSLAGSPELLRKMRLSCTAMSRRDCDAGLFGVPARPLHIESGLALIISVWESGIQAVKY